MAIKCKKCGLYFAGIKCKCGWEVIRQKKQEEYFGHEVFKKGDSAIAEKHIADCYKILRESQLRNGVKSWDFGEWGAF